MSPNVLLISLFKKIILVTAFFMLSNCGFEPLHKHHDSQNTKIESFFSKISISKPTNRMEQKLRNLLLEHIDIHGNREEPKYQLTLSLKTHESALGIRSDHTSVRNFINVRLTYTLTEIESGKILTSSHFIKENQFPTDQSGFANRLAREKAIEYNLANFRDQLTRKLALVFRQQTIN